MILTLFFVTEFCFAIVSYQFLQNSSILLIDGLFYNIRILRTFSKTLLSPFFNIKFSVDEVGKSILKKTFF